MSFDDIPMSLEEEFAIEYDKLKKERDELQWKLAVAMGKLEWLKLNGCEHCLRSEVAAVGMSLIEKGKPS